MSHPLPRHVIVFAKSLQLGRVKTRLQSKLTPEQCLVLHQAFVLDTLELVEQSQTESRQLLFSQSPAQELMAGRQERWEVGVQRGEDLGERLENAARDAFENGSRKVIFLGTDSPHLPPWLLQEAFEALESHPVVLGPAEDGGYYLLGIREPASRLFEDIDWGTERVLEQTRARIFELGWEHKELDTWFDIDRPEDLQRLQGLLQEFDSLRHTRHVMGRWSREILSSPAVENSSKRSFQPGIE